MKHFVKLSLCTTALCAASASYAATQDRQTNWYAGVSGDLTWLSHSDLGGGGNVELGYRAGPVRVEAEAGYHGAGGDTGFSSTHYMSYMGNLYYDFNSMMRPTASGWHVVPYIGAGLGDAAVHYGNSSLSNTFHHHSNEFAYEGMAGITLASAAMHGTDLSLGYRYLGTDNGNLHSNNLELGVRFHF